MSSYSLTARASFACLMLAPCAGGVRAQAPEADASAEVALVDAGASPSPTPPSPPPLDAPAAQAAIPEMIDVTVRTSKAQEIRESARAVDVIELARERRSTSDLGQVLSRQEGINVRRAGALGSDARLSLNGLSDEQVRLFIDGVPLDLAGYPFGINNVPVEVAERIEVHRGVVPLRLGTDSLGGAIELISDPGVRGSHGNVSYQGGSFDTHRLLASGRHYDAKTGLFVRVEGFLDKAENDYPIDVPLMDARGYTRIRVRRNNDAYRAGFGGVEMGVVQRSWARRLTLRAFLGDLDKELPSDPQMLSPYGEVDAERRVTGTLGRFESVPVAGFTVSAIAGYSLRQSTLRDLSSCGYDFVGRCVANIAPARGERETPSEQHVTQHTTLGRLTIARALGSAQQLRVSVSPTFTRRSGENRALPPGDDDPLEGKRVLNTVVSGAEHQLDVLDDRLQNIAFFKHYLMRTESNDLAGAGGFVEVDNDHSRFGAGDGLRYRFTDALYGKLSYEWATRLPAPDEIFGNPEQLLEKNLQLKPESAHNINVGGAGNVQTARAGQFRGQVTSFARLIDDLIYRFVETNSTKFNNVQRARSLGVEGSAGWTSPGRWAQLDANATYQDYRNNSNKGDFAMHRGDRIPNRPYLFANVSAQLFAQGLLDPTHELSLLFRTNFVQGYQVGWESVNGDGDKLRVPSQVVHSVGINLLLKRDKTTIGSSIEVHNLTDERVYDYFGVQLPGRTVAAKLTLGV